MLLALDTIFSQNMEIKLFFFQKDGWKESWMRKCTDLQQRVEQLAHMWLCHDSSSLISGHLGKPIFSCITLLKNPSWALKKKGCSQDSISRWVRGLSKNRCTIPSVFCSFDLKHIACSLKWTLTSQWRWSGSKDGPSGSCRADSRLWKQQRLATGGA